MKRRRFISAAVGGAVARASNTFSGIPEAVPIIDTHIHLFDVSRPQGVPWPPKNSAIYKSALPERFRRVAASHGVMGAIEIECSPWLDDNRWVLDVASKDPIIVGTIGDLEPGTPGFARQLDRLHTNPLFRGIRYGNIWDRDLGRGISNPGFVSDLKLLRAAGLVLDTANPDPALIHAVVRLSDRIPDLKIVIDHLPELTPPDNAAARKACDADLGVLGQRPQVFAKLSGIVRRVDGRVPLDLNFYRDRLDHIWGTLGPDRLMYGSDWPNSDQWATYSDVFRLAKEFISSKDRLSIEKFYWKNSRLVYSWIQRDVSQNCLRCG